MCEEESESVLKAFGLSCQLLIVLFFLLLDLHVDPLLKDHQDVAVCVARKQVRIVFLIALQERVLRHNKLKWLRLSEHLLKNRKERIRVKVQKPLHKLLICTESHNIHNIVAPPRCRQITLRKHLPFQIQRNNPQNLVANVDTTVLDRDLLVPRQCEVLPLLLFLPLRCVFSVQLEDRVSESFQVLQEA